MQKLIYIVIWLLLTSQANLFASFAWQEVALEEWVVDESASRELSFFEPYGQESNSFMSQSLFGHSTGEGMTFHKMYTQTIQYPDEQKTQRKVKKPKTKAQQAGYSIGRFFIITVGSYPITFAFTSAILFPLTYRKIGWDYQRQMTAVLLISLTASAAIALIDMIIDLSIKAGREKRLKKAREAQQKATEQAMANGTYLQPTLNIYAGLNKPTKARKGDLNELFSL